MMDYFIFMPFNMLNRKLRRWLGLDHNSDAIIVRGKGWALCRNRGMEFSCFDWLYLYQV